MRLALTTLAVGLALGIAAGVVGSNLAQAAGPNQTFTLEAHDTILTEAAGCQSECRIFGGRRNCMVKSFDCKAICRTLPECRPDGRPMQVCAIVRQDAR